MSVIGLAYEYMRAGIFEHFHCVNPPLFHCWNVLADLKTPQDEQLEVTLLQAQVPEKIPRLVCH